MDEAIEMYQELHKWDDAIIVAEAKVIHAYQYSLEVYQTAVYLHVNGNVQWLTRQKQQKS